MAIPTAAQARAAQVAINTDEAIAMAVHQARRDGENVARVSVPAAEAADKVASLTAAGYLAASQPGAPGGRHMLTVSWSTKETLAEALADEAAKRSSDATAFAAAADPERQARAARRAAREAVRERLNNRSPGGEP